MVRAPWAEWSRSSPSRKYIGIRLGRGAVVGFAEKCEGRLLFVPRLALRAFCDVHFAAQRDGRDDEEERQEAHSRFLNKLGHVATCAAAHELGGQLRTPEDHFGPNDEHGRNKVAGDGRMSKQRRLCGIRLCGFQFYRIRCRDAAPQVATPLRHS